MTETKTVVGSYTDRNNNTAPTALMVESNITNTLNSLRKELGLAHTRNAYPWWTYALAALTYVEKATVNQLQTILSESDINVNLKCTSTLLQNALDGFAPSKIQREYTGKLPALVKATKLRSMLVNKSEFYDVRSIVDLPRFGRIPRQFFFVNRVEAREKIISMYPHTRHLFAQLDYHQGEHSPALVSERAKQMLKVKA